MERIIHNLMDYCHISEEEFRERVLVENDMEPLYFPYYEYAYVKSFADRFGCEMTVQKNGGGHWFHTEEELDFFRNWLRERL